MLLGELVTLKHYELPVKIVLFDNATLAMVRLEMLVEGLPIATDSPKIDYAAVASAMGIHDPRALAPPKVTGNQIAGFTTAMSKEILGGGMGEVMAMARSNLRNVPRA